MKSKVQYTNYYYLRKNLQELLKIDYSANIYFINDFSVNVIFSGLNAFHNETITAAIDENSAPRLDRGYCRGNKRAEKLATAAAVAAAQLLYKNGNSAETRNKIAIIFETFSNNAETLRRIKYGKNYNNY